MSIQTNIMIPIDFKSLVVGYEDDEYNDTEGLVIRYEEVTFLADFGPWKLGDTPDVLCFNTKTGQIWADFNARRYIFELVQTTRSLEEILYRL